MPWCTVAPPACHAVRVYDTDGLVIAERRAVRRLSRGFLFFSSLRSSKVLYEEEEEEGLHGSGCSTAEKVSTAADDLSTLLLCHNLVATPQYNLSSTLSTT